MIARQSRPIANTVKFVQHEVFEYQTLASSLCTALNSQEGKDGSAYIYTHKQDPFSGMIKIGYTCSRIQTRLDYWAQCGHGHPTLLWSHTRVRHPKRVELLTHFELLEFWHEQQYCSFHNSAHVEWFKTDVETASSIVSDWSSWMESNPYDRRGNIKPFWEDTIDFIELYEIPFTAKTMLQIHQLEIGILSLSDFMDDGFEKEERFTTANAEDKSLMTETRQTRNRYLGSEQPAVQPLSTYISPIPRDESIGGQRYETLQSVPWIAK